MSKLLIGTRDGVFELTGDAAKPDPGFGARGATAIVAADAQVWAVADRRVLVRRDEAGTWIDVARSDELELACVLPTPAGPLAGTEGAHLLRLRDGGLERVESFEAVAGRNSWYTPWGGPPAVRSIAVDLAGRIHANVHVGGIPRSADGGASWEPTIDIDADVHQVIAHPSEPDLVLAAGAVGLALSEDGGASWRTLRDGLHSTYARAVAVAGGTVLLSASDGPRGGRAAVYRAALGLQVRLEKCTEGLPEWFEGNIDSGCLAAAGSAVAFGTGDGQVFVSDDEGGRWRLAAEGLPAIRALCQA
jgi:hypothetical protein